jgi:hypothetical protein
MSFDPNLPPELQPTQADLARDVQLAREVQSLSAANNTLGVKWNTETYNAVTLGPDGRAVSRIVNGVSQMTEQQQAVARAQSSANAELQRMKSEVERLIGMRDAITGYNPDGSPHYVRSDAARGSLDSQIKQLHQGLLNQTRLNERKWREDAARSFTKNQDMRALAAEFEAAGRVTRARTY